MSSKKKEKYTEPRVLEGPGPFAFVGDIHGCYDELVELEEQIKRDHPDVTMISLGDFCDRGPKVHEALKHCRESGWEATLGNHDEKMLRWAKGNPVKLRPHHVKTTEVLTDEDIEYMRSMSWFIRVPYYDIIAVHGGLWPNVQPEKQDPKQMIRMAAVDIESHKLVKAEDETEDTKHWSEYWKGPEQVLYGHTAWREVHIDDDGWTVGLDTGCVYGNKLSGLVAFVDEHGEKDIKIYQVRAQQQYWESSLPGRREKFKANR